VQEALKRSEERYALAQRAANIGSWDWDIQTNDLHWSDQIEPIFGFGRGEFAGTYEAFLECVYPKDRQTVIDAVAACVERGDDYAIEHRIIWPDGAVRWVSEMGDVITDETGQAVRMLGVVRDITARKHADEQLRRLSRVVEQSPSMVVITDTAGKIEYVNPQFTEITGYAAVDALGKSPHLLKSGQHSSAYYRDLWDRILDGREWRGEIVNRKKNGESYWELASISPIRNAEGTITHFAKLAQDITERKQAQEALQESEERYRDLVENLNDVIYALDGDARITYISPAVEPFMGYRPTEVMGHHFTEFIYPEDLDRIQASFREILSGRLVEPDEYRIVTKAGGIRWMRTSSRPVVVENRFSGVQGVLVDITERVLAEQALQDAKEVAEAARREEVERRLEADQRRRIAESLADVLAVLNSNQDLDQVLDYIAVQAGQLLENQAVAIYNLQGETETLSIQATQGLPIGYVAGADIPIGHGALSKAVRLREPVTVADVMVGLFDNGELAQDAYHRALVEYWADIYRALLAVPIIVKDEIYGGIVLYFAKPRTFSDDEIGLAMAFANQAALAIENSRLRDQVQLTAATAERSRLARDLHDAVTQTLFSASLIAEAMPRVWERDQAEARRGLEELRHLTRGASAEMRTMLLELRPAALTEKPMGELLRHLVEAVTGRTRVPVTLTMEGKGSLPPQIQIAYFRIAQEALNNMAKHSGASQAAVELHFEAGQVTLRVCDDGCGFDLGDTRPDQLGLDIMRERAESIGAVLEIQSQPGSGTQVVVNWRGAQGRGSDG
jgi:PAS domain S-box-containing protein